MPLKGLTVLFTGLLRRFSARTTQPNSVRTAIWPAFIDSAFSPQARRPVSASTPLSIQSAVPKGVACAQRPPLCQRVAGRRRGSRAGPPRIATSARCRRAVPFPCRRGTWEDILVGGSPEWQAAARRELEVDDDRPLSGFGTLPGTDSECRVTAARSLSASGAAGQRARRVDRLP